MPAAAAAGSAAAATEIAHKPGTSDPARRDADLHYKIYVGGFHVLDVNVDLGLDAARYDVAARARTIGMIADMFPWSMQAYSRGDIAGGRVAPAAAGQRNNWRGRERFIDLRYRDGIAVVERIAPQPRRDDRDAVPEAMRRDAVDLASALLAVLRRLDADAPCAARVPVFDGRRRYDLVVRPDGSDRLRASRFSPYAGEAVTCRLSIDRKAGFKRNDDSGWNDGERSARVWLGRAFARLPPLPVRISLDTPFGAMFAHLSRATLAAGGHTEVLSHADAAPAAATQSP